MNIQGQAALVTGGGSGLGEATARELARLGAKVAVLDLNMDNAQRVAKDIGEQYGNGSAVAVSCNVSDPDSMAKAIETAAAAHGPARILMQIAGIGTAKRVVGKDGNAAPLEDFMKVVNVNLVGTYNAARLFAAAASKLDPLEDGERGVMVWTASVAAFDGQVGQQAYSASKAHGPRLGTTRHPRVHHRSWPLCHATHEDIARASARVARREHPLPLSLGQAGRVCATGLTHCEQHAPQWRSHSLGWRTAHGTTLIGKTK
jgi:NADP-dependent 3-hydroxy acid dehydrogenase YdfG